MVNDLLEILMKNDRLKAAATGRSPVAPEMQQAQARQNIWTGNEYNTPAQPLGQDVSNLVAGKVYDNADQYDTGSAELKARLGMNTRPLNEQLMGIANITDKADIQSRQDYSKETQAQQAHDSSTGQTNTGGDLDTARHTQLSAMLRQKLGYAGSQLALQSHEGFGIPALQSNPRESQRDTRNNEQGIALGENAPAGDIRGLSNRITNVMSNKTIMPYMQAALRQSAWRNP